MSIQQFCLRWNNHQPNFISVFTTLLNNESLVDVTLAAEGKHLQAHKVVLSACSVYFQTLFTANPSRHPIVILKDVKYSDLRIMVDFMYYGEVNVSQEQLPQILETAKMLKIKGLTEMPDSTSLTKAQSSSSERADLLTPGESSWGSDTQRHSISPCNLSPSMKRKRLRKTSTGSGSTSIEKSTEDKHFVDHSAATLNLVKTDSITLSSVPQHNVKIKTKELQYSDFQTSKESLDENGGVDNPLSLVKNATCKLENKVWSYLEKKTDIPTIYQIYNKDFKTSSETSNLCSHIEKNTDDTNNCLMRGVEQSLDDPAANLSQQGPQWTMLEQGYPRYTTPTCHTNAHQNTSSSTLNNIQTQESSVPPFNVPLMNPHINIDICDYQQQQQHLQSSQTANDMESCSPGPSCVNNLNNISNVPETPINNAPPKRRRTNNPQSEENFQRALEAVRFGGIGFCKAARMFGVNNRTLWLEYKKKGYPNNRPSIKNRIKQEHSSPPPEVREELPIPQEQQLTLLCPPHTVGMMGFIDSRQMDFGNIQNISRPRFGEDNINIHSSPINLHGQREKIMNKRGKLLIRQQRIKKDSESIASTPDEEASTSEFVSSIIQRQVSEPILPSVKAMHLSKGNLVKKQYSHSTPYSHMQNAIKFCGVSTASPLLPFSIILESNDILPSCTSSAVNLVKESVICDVDPPSASSEAPIGKEQAVIENVDNARSSHCPVIRPGPSLSCNYCWNTVDDQGRILRRKTKYHCPECQVNLCIVPCFHEYHERNVT